MNYHFCHSSGQLLSDWKRLLYKSGWKSWYLMIVIKLCPFWSDRHVTNNESRFRGWDITEVEDDMDEMDIGKKWKVHKILLMLTETTISISQFNLLVPPFLSTIIPSFLSLPMSSCTSVLINRFRTPLIKGLFLEDWWRTILAQMCFLADQNAAGRGFKSVVTIQFINDFVTLSQFSWATATNLFSGRQSLQIKLLFPCLYHSTKHRGREQTTCSDLLSRTFSALGDNSYNQIRRWVYICIPSLTHVTAGHIRAKNSKSNETIEWTRLDLW